MDLHTVNFVRLSERATSVAEFISTCMVHLFVRCCRRCCLGARMYCHNPPLHSHCCRPSTPTRHTQRSPCSRFLFVRNRNGLSIVCAAINKRFSAATILSCRPKNGNEWRASEMPRFRPVATTCTGNLNTELEHVPTRRCTSQNTNNTRHRRAQMLHACVGERFYIFKCVMTR